MPLQEYGQIPGISLVGFFLSTFQTIRQYQINSTVIRRLPIPHMHVEQGPRDIPSYDRRWYENGRCFGCVGGAFRVRGGLARTVTIDRIAGPEIQIVPRRVHVPIRGS